MDQVLRRLDHNSTPIRRSVAPSGALCKVNRRHVGILEIHRESILPVNVLLSGFLTVAQPKYWCKHCSAYIRDTAFEKRQHEATAKHQNNLKRFLRDIQNSHERGEREKERAKAEVERLNKVVGGAAAGASTLTAPPKSSTTVRKTPTGPHTSEDQKRQWAQLAEMGIDVPDEFRAEMAMAGQWKAVPETKSQNRDPTGDSLSVGIRKRKLDEDEQEQLDSGTVPSARKVWGKSVRTYPGQQTESLDELLSGVIPLQKDKKEQGVKHEPAEAQASSAPDASALVMTPANDASPEARVNAALAKQEPNDDSTSLVKTERAAGRSESPLLGHTEETPIPVFKKRKAKAAPAQ